MASDLLLITDERMLEHDPAMDQPETPARLRAILERLRSDSVEGALPGAWANPGPASREAIERVHATSHIDLIESLRGQSAVLDWDTAVSPGSVAAAGLAAGAGLLAVDAVLDGDARRSFALVRPPGHHAERDRAMGFCLYNNIAIAAAYAIAKRSIGRVLIIDWDVHHGNGTQHLFEDRNDVLYFSVHQSPLYPGTGAVGETGHGAGVGYTVNVPLPPGAGDGEYIAVFRELLVPIAEQFDPELVLVSAGFDSHVDDPLGGMRVTESGFGAMCAIVVDLAERTAEGRLALLLEGGYDLAGLAGSVRACAGVLGREHRDSIENSVTGDAMRAMIDSVRHAHQRWWPAWDGEH